jgi:hypothetical protein
MPEIVPCYLSLLFLASAHFTAGQWVDVGYEHVITKESYYQLFRFDPLLIFFVTYCLLTLKQANTMSLILSLLNLLSVRTGFFFFIFYDFQ